MVASCTREGGGVTALAVKSCTKCGESKPIGSFGASPRYAGGVKSWCKGCEKSYRAAHYQRNKDRVRAQNSEWHAANRAERNEAMRTAYAANPEKHIARAKRAKERRPDHYRELNRVAAQRRRESRIDVRLRSRISSQFRYCLGTGKGGATTEALLGYGIPELRLHIERQFLPGMGWGNMGEWHIDHIIPLARFTITGPDDPELRRAWALTNLRPLWAADNIAKGDKLENLL